MKKVVISLSTVLSVMLCGSSSPLFADEGAKPTCTVQKIDACIQANKEGRAKTIEEYVCPAGTLKTQEIAFQVCMSIGFKELDDKVKGDLKTIYGGSNKNIGQLATNVRDLFDSSNEKAVYPRQYADICNKTTMDKTVLYFQEKGKSDKTSDSVTTDNGAMNFVFGEKGCEGLVERKLQAYKESAWLLGESAVVKSFKNDKHDYMRHLKDQYEKFLNKWTTYIGQLSVIKDKWPSKTKKVQ